MGECERAPRVDATRRHDRVPRLAFGRARRPARTRRHGAAPRTVRPRAVVPRTLPPGHPGPPRTVPRPAACPRALRESAPPRWYGTATATLAYAQAGHAPKGALTQVAGSIAVAATHTAHAVMAARGEWVTNEKGLVERAGLGEVDALLEELTSGPDALAAAVAEAEGILARSVEV